VLALWLRSDRQARNFSVPFEFDAFMFFAWPFLLPWYLYQTRKSRGLLYAAAATYGLASLAKPLLCNCQHRFERLNSHLHPALANRAKALVSEMLLKTACSHSNTSMNGLLKTDN
jgi:hypothetical protein